jgi:hypothetical protein
LICKHCTGCDPAWSANGRRQPFVDVRGGLSLSCFAQKHFSIFTGGHRLGLLLKTLRFKIEELRSPFEAAVVASEHVVRIHGLRVQVD